MILKFTQYLRPDGRAVPVTTDCPEDAKQEALVLVNNGCVFELECLTTGHASMTVHLDDPDEPLSHKICANEPEKVQEAVKNLIIDAHKRFVGEKQQLNG